MQGHLQYKKKKSQSHIYVNDGPTHFEVKLSVLISKLPSLCNLSDKSDLGCATFGKIKDELYSSTSFIK